MRQETELFKDKIEVSLEGRQVFYLFFGGAVVASLVFVLGVMVGKRVENRSQQSSAAIASTAEDPLAALDQLGQGQHKSFRSALIEGDADPRYDVDIALSEQTAKAEKAAAEKREQRAAANAKARKAREEKAKEAAAKAAVKAAAKAAKEAKAEQTAAAKAAAKEAAAEAKAAKDAAARAAAEKRAASKAKAAKAGAGKFTLQLSSFRNRAEADSFHDTLKKAGFAPYIVEAEVPGKGTWYRVRFGSYQTYDEALDAKKVFEDKQGRIAYVTRIKR